MTLYGPLASKSTFVDTEHLPKVRKTVTPITSLIFQGQTRTVGSELTLESAPGLVSREQKQLLDHWLTDPGNNTLQQTPALVVSL